MRLLQANAEPHGIKLSSLLLLQARRPRALLDQAYNIHLSEAIAPLPNLCIVSLVQIIMIGTTSSNVFAREILASKPCAEVGKKTLQGATASQGN
jgi:hypothetical protein